MIPLSGRVPGRAFGPSRTRVDDGDGLQYFSWIDVRALGFSRWSEFIGRRAMSEGARGAHTIGWHDTLQTYHEFLMFHACFTPIALCFVYTLWYFYLFFGTNLLTRCHSVSSCILLFLCFRKVTQEIFSELDETKTKVPIYLTRRWSPKERRRRTRRRPHHRVARATPWPRHQVVWAPGPPSDITHPHINSLSRENPKGPITFPWNILQAATVIDSKSGGARSSSRHPAEEENHHRMPSSSPCQPPEWRVSSPPLDHGSIAVARWLSSPPCALCVDLVSCL
jgi:hypothetical protein